MKNSKKVFLIFTAAFLGCVLLVGMIFGTVSIIRSSRSVMKYKGIYVTEGVANYLTASYKRDFLSALRRELGYECPDDESFWQSDSGDGKTYGELLCESTEKYIESVIVGSYLFDRNTRLTKTDKEKIKASINEVLEYSADGDKDRFNEIGEPMGFDFGDFKKAAKLLYKQKMAKDVIFGYDGEALKTGAFGAECDEYFTKAYSRVMLMLIRTDGRFVTDPNTGKEVFEEYNETERAGALEKIEEMRKIIADGQMNEDAFLWFILNEHPTGMPNDTYGYYFSASSAYSQQFTKESGSDLVELALSMKKGEYSECEVDIGVFFIYKCDLDERAYENTAISHFFGDFYNNAADYIYDKSVDSYILGVKVGKKYNRSAAVTIEPNIYLPIRFD